MTSLKQLESRMKMVELRNKRVELDKAWETSWTRKLFLIVTTYLAVSLYLHAIHVPNPWLNAIVPAGGFLLSTLSLPLIKRFWASYLYHR